jgi:protein-S-isoprenylcysteine O-methyltransferase Ste14
MKPNEAVDGPPSGSIVNLLKSLLHNIGVAIVGFGVAYLGVSLDSLMGWRQFRSLPTGVAALLLLATGFLLRVWATYLFYERQMKVISLVPQKRLVTTGPYRFSRNPLYLGGNVFIFFGAALFLGSPAGLLLTMLHLPFLDLFIRREEKQLERAFGDEWMRYKSQVRRWL